MLDILPGSAGLLLVGGCCCGLPGLVKLAVAPPALLLLSAAGGACTVLTGCGTAAEDAGTPLTCFSALIFEAGCAWLLPVWLLLGCGLASPLACDVIAVPDPALELGFATLDAISGSGGTICQPTVSHDPEAHALAISRERIKCCAEEIQKTARQAAVQLFQSQRRHGHKRPERCKGAYSDVYMAHCSDRTCHILAGLIGGRRVEDEQGRQLACFQCSNGFSSY